MTRAWGRLGSTPPPPLLLLLLLLETTMAVTVVVAAAMSTRDQTAASVPARASRCAGRACNPPLGNLAQGRSLSTLTQCGLNGSEPACVAAGGSPEERHSGHRRRHRRGRETDMETEGGAAACRRGPCRAVCDSRAGGGAARSPSAMADSPFARPRSWWQSAGGARADEVRLDLGGEFLFTHMVAIFRSSRPAAMLLERSRDGGVSWTPLQFFAADCRAEFALADDADEPGAVCTSRYSQARPCTGGEVIFRAVTPSRPLDDPFGAAARQRLGVTNLRLRLLRRQECRRCPAPAPPSGAASSAVGGGEGADSSPGHFAVYDLILRGSCLCHGHAERCEPAPGASSSSSSSLVSVHGRCVCHHHTEGQHCERCRPIYNDRPWQPGNGKTGEPNECQKCHCNGHADSCHLDRALWEASGNRSGGVCDGCRHHTEGRHCHRCKPGFYRHPAESGNSPRTCRACECHPLGALTNQRQASCDPGTGYCFCKPGVGGRHCDRCMMGYWGFGEGGCIPCHCAGSCDPHTGTCTEGFDAEPRHEVPVGGRIPDLIPSSPNRHAAKAGWEDEQQGFSAARDPGKCLCKDRTIASVEEFCAMKYTYVLKARVLSAHDRGSHAEVNVKVDKVLRGARRRGDSSGGTLYPESWTHRGCTCPVLNPGMDYLIAGQEDLKTKRLVVDLNSYVKPWKSSVAKEVMAFLRAGCPKA
ncbi:netrin-4 [Lethenteron reissneri]|uniref:netrin-4 n=1 Tax=Lethenteron reissneri TaxID=7753 RepID=UPI002AB795C6|nr:netrin-4 [Lethenteron reissneri]